MTCTADSRDPVLSVEPQALRNRLSPPSAYLTAALVIGLSLFASATPSPLYGICGSPWHLSPGEITGAALLDLHPRHDAAATGIANGVAAASSPDKCASAHTLLAVLTSRPRPDGGSAHRSYLGGAHDGS